MNGLIKIPGMQVIQRSELGFHLESSLRNLWIPQRIYRMSLEIADPTSSFAQNLALNF